MIAIVRFVKVNDLLIKEIFWASNLKKKFLSIQFFFVGQYFLLSFSPLQLY